MASTEYKLSYTAAEIDAKLGKVDNLSKIVLSDNPPNGLGSGDYWYMVMDEIKSPKELFPYIVTLVDGVGYSIVAVNGSTSPVYRGDSYTFTVSIANGYEAGSDFAVKVNGKILTASNCVYTISNITIYLFKHTVSYSIQTNCFVIL